MFLVQLSKSISDHDSMPLQNVTSNFNDNLTKYSIAIILFGVKPRDYVDWEVKIGVRDIYSLCRAGPNGRARILATGSAESNSFSQNSVFMSKSTLNMYKYFIQNTISYFF